MNFKQIQTQKQVLDRRDSRSMDWAILIAIVLHIGILYLPPLASFDSSRQFSAPVKPVIDITILPPKAPPPKQPPEARKSVKRLVVPILRPSDEPVNLENLLPDENIEWVIDPSLVEFPPVEPMPETPLRPGGNVMAPVLVSQVAPVYPEAVRRIGLQGEVVLDAVIDRQGYVRNVTIAESFNTMCNNAAIEAVRQWRYKPGTQNEVPVEVILRLRVQFRITR